MTDEISGKKIRGVKQTTQTTSVEGTEAVSGVAGVKPTAAVTGVRRAGGINVNRSTRSMSLAEREQLFRMINEEADKLFSEGAIPQSKRQVIAEAVKMTIDSGLLPEEQEETRKK